MCISHSLGTGSKAFNLAKRKSHSVFFRNPSKCYKKTKFSW